MKAAKLIGFENFQPGGIIQLHLLCCCSNRVWMINHHYTHISTGTKIIIVHIIIHSLYSEPMKIIEK